MPWRKNLSSYAVWVSEIMLQQTQVITVIPYFKKWMEIFPDIASLALADESEIFKLWEGLGYYSRVRRLHLSAKILHKKGLTELPQKLDELLKLPGIGEYTAGAILNFAWKRQVVAIDGNVMRVIARLFCLESIVESSKTQLIIREKMEIILKACSSDNMMESVIELGALVCKKQPLCHRCPVKDQCRAFLQGKTDLIPKKRQKKPIVKLYRFVPVLIRGDEVALEKRGKGEIMEGLYEFPYYPFSQRDNQFSKLERLL